MKTIILPGVSIKNKDWAYAAKYNLPELDIIIHEWFHWITEKDEDFSVEQETQRLNIREPINIIAKSIGTYITSSMLKNNTENKINKIIFCGIPLKWLEEHNLDLNIYNVLKDVDPKKILVIQNENDFLASHKEVLKLLKKINKDIEVVSKPRDDHEYPYWEEFRNFLG